MSCFGTRACFWVLQRLAAGISVLALLSGCAAPAPVIFTATPEPTATNTIEPTATIIWFPATATYTPYPTREITPTVNLRPELGEILLEDDFTGDEWQTGRSPQGSVAYGNGELTLAVSAEEGTLLSLRSVPQFDDFYLEINVQPSLCRSGDAYGLLLRASSPGDLYRLLINCDGSLRLERLKGSRSLALQDWTPSGQLPPGGFLETRLGVWAGGEEIRVLINDELQFVINDPVWTSGQVGVYARAAGTTPLTVSFSDLVVYSIDPGAPPLQSSPPTPSPTGE